MGTRKKRRRRVPLTWDGIFNGGGGLLRIIVVLATFITAWAYCTIYYGFLFGFGLGWFPAGMLAAIVGVVSWLASPLAVGLLLGPLLLIALWQDPKLLVWLTLAFFAVWLIWRRRFGDDGDWPHRRLGRRQRELKSRGKRDATNGGIFTALTALLATAERKQNSSRPKAQSPKELQR